MCVLSFITYPILLKPYTLELIWRAQERKHHQPYFPAIFKTMKMITK